MIEPLRQILDDAIAAERCSAAAVAVGDGGRELATYAVGATRRVPTPGVPVGVDAIFDLASVTKVMATTAIAIALVSRRRLDLAAPARALLPSPTADAVDPRVTVLHLLGHGAGYPAHVPFYERIRAGDLAGQPDPRRAIVHLAASHPLAHPPGERAIYSDLGYLTLGAVLEAAGGARLDALFADLVAGPLGLARARFVDLAAPAAARPPWPAPIVATEQCPVRGLVEGEVHDENAHAAGGIAAHAGLFAPLADVSAFGRAMVALLGGADVGGLSADVARAFATTRAAPDASHVLGWDTPSATPGVSHAGDRWPRAGAFGHLGFTGTSLWLDVPHRRWVALLTNRVHPSRHGERAAAIKDVRRAVHDAVVEMLS